jgi:hypothetical protein
LAYAGDAFVEAAYQALTTLLIAVTIATFRQAVAYEFSAFACTYLVFTAKRASTALHYIAGLAFLCTCRLFRRVPFAGLADAVVAVRNTITLLAVYCTDVLTVTIHKL